MKGEKKITHKTNCLSNTTSTKILVNFLLILFLKHLFLHSFIWLYSSYTYNFIPCFFKLVLKVETTLFSRENLI